MLKINALTGLQEIVKTKKAVWLLLYKKGLPQSDCSFVNFTSACEKNGTDNFLHADLNQARDIHPAYGVTSVPALLHFKEGKLVNITKGCQDPKTYKALFESAVFVSPSESKAAPERRVVVYTAPGCTWCTAVKRHLEAHRVRYREVDVAKDPEAARKMVKKSGKQGVPQIDINGQIVVGFDQLTINKLTGIK